MYDVSRAEPYDVRRVPVAAEQLVSATYDYADSFQLRFDHADAHPAEEWVRAALEGAAPVVLALVRFVHGRVARFELRPDGILGWEVLSSTYDAVHIRTAGPLLRAEIVTRRRSDDAATFTTFLFYESRVTPVLWRVIGPVHRRVAPYLLRRAAVTLRQDRPVA